jgi:hypothetical protein
MSEPSSGVYHNVQVQVSRCPDSRASEMTFARSFCNQHLPTSTLQKFSCFSWLHLRDNKTAVSIGNSLIRFEMAQRYGQPPPPPPPRIPESWVSAADQRFYTAAIAGGLQVSCAVHALFRLISFTLSKGVQTIRRLVSLLQDNTIDLGSAYNIDISFTNSDHQ